jgi:hypothetical protein
MSFWYSFAAVRATARWEMDTGVSLDAGILADGTVPRKHEKAGCPGPID